VKDFIKQRLTSFLMETKNDSHEYQIRDIGGSIVYYKRKKGNKIWSFTDEKDFNGNSTKSNIIK
jgi:hypothetical protein